MNYYVFLIITSTYDNKHIVYITIKVGQQLHSNITELLVWECEVLFTNANTAVYTFL